MEKFPLELIVEGGAFALLAFVLWWTFKNLIPGLVEKFGEIEQNQRTHYDEMTAQQREFFARESALGRQEADELKTAVKELTHEMRRVSPTPQQGD